MYKRIINSFLGVLLSIGMLPIAPLTVLATEGVDVDSVTEATATDISEDDIIPEDNGFEVEEQVVVSTSDMLHFLMDVRWGNVRGDIEDSSETNFDGSVSVPSTGHVTLRKLLLFEGHDDLTGEQDPIEWKSLIYGHWDGVRAVVSAQAGDIVTVSTTQGTLTTTAKEIFESQEPIVLDVGSGREIVLRARKLERRGFFMAVGWGHPNRHTNPEPLPIETQVSAVSHSDAISIPRLNFSGSATLGGGSRMKAVRPLRFERLQGDKILEYDDQHVSWRSIIRGGLDGILLRLHPDRTRDGLDKLTIRFPQLEFSQSWSLLDLYHTEAISVDVPVPGHDLNYQLILRRWRHPNRKLIRGRNSDKVFVVEGDLRRHVVSADAFGRSGLLWEDVEVVDDEDVDTYADGDPFGYDDGALIKGSGPKVWVITDGKRRHISDPAAFTRLGYNWDNLIVIPDADVDQYEEEDELAGTAQAPEGSLLRVEGDPKVYFIEGGRRKHVPNPDVFESRRLRWDHVQIVSPDVVSELPVGDALNYPNGAVVQALDGRIFEIENGERHHLKSARELLLRGHTWESVRRDETGVLIDLFVEGEAVELLDDVSTL